MDKKIQLNSIYRRYYDAEYLKNEELVAGAKHFKALADLLNISGPEFKIAFKEAVQLSISLEDMANARGLNIEEKPAPTSESLSL